MGASDVQPVFPPAADIVVAPPMQAVTKQQAAERAATRRLAKQHTLDDFLGPKAEGTARAFKPYKCRAPARAMKRIFSEAEGT